MSFEPSETLLSKLPLIEQIVFMVCRRNGMPREAIEEFSAELKLRLVEDDYAVIRAYRGHSSFATYIATVVSRALLDHRIREWGKWYASAAATKLGMVAVDLERMLYRDERTLDEAIAVLTPQYPELTRPEFEALAEKLPPRLRRRHVSLDNSLMEVAAPVIFEADHASVAARISAIVRKFIERLPRQDQQLLRLRFDADMSAPQISRALHLDQQVVYRRLYRLFEAMRKNLESEGIDSTDIEEIIGSDTASLDFHLQSETGPRGLVRDHELPVVQGSEES